MTKQGKSRKMANSGNKIQRLVHKAIENKMEHKTNVVSQAPTLISAAGGIAPLSQSIFQGDDFFSRTGDMITIVQNKLNFRFRAVATDQTGRFVVFRDNMNIGSVPAVTDVLAIASYRSEYNPLLVIQQKRFTILSDTFLDSNLNGETLKTRALRLGPSGKCFYNGPTNAAASNGKGAIFLLIIGDAATGFFEYTSQITFTDA